MNLERSLQSRNPPENTKSKHLSSGDPTKLSLVRLLKTRDHLYNKYRKTKTCSSRFYIKMQKSGATVVRTTLH